MTTDKHPYGILIDGPPLLLPPYNGYKEWKVSSKKVCRYLTRDSLLITLPADMMTDLNSCRNVPLVGLLLDADGKDATAAVFHDYGYRYHPEVSDLHSDGRRTLTRAQWDRIFWDLMRLCGKDRVRSWMLYRGVRIFGWRAWR